MADSFGEVFVGFEGEACGFTSSERVLQNFWLGFVIREFLKLVSEVCSKWDGLQVQQERRCWGEGGKKGLQKSYWFCGRSQLQN